MPHYLQESRKRNVELVKKLLARAMPRGLKDETFQAKIIREYGFSLRAMRDYIRVLKLTNEIKLDKDHHWRIIFTLNNEKKGKE